MIGVLWSFILINVIFIAGVVVLLLLGIKVLKGLFEYIVNTIKRPKQQK